VICPAAVFSLGQVIAACAICLVAWPVTAALFRAFERIEEGK
jgi:hypothetical protein